MLPSGRPLGRCGLFFGAVNSKSRLNHRWSRWSHADLDNTPRRARRCAKINPTMRTLNLVLFVLGIAALPIAAQDLPDGPAKETFVKVCTQCHGVDIIVTLKHTKDEWKTVIDTMASYGASAKDEEFDAIIDYLAKNFGKPDTAANLKSSAAQAK